jgi:hypothetical protein
MLFRTFEACGAWQSTVRDIVLGVCPSESERLSNSVLACKEECKGLCSLHCNCLASLTRSRPLWALIAELLRTDAASRRYTLACRDFGFITMRAPRETGAFFPVYSNQSFFASFYMRLSPDAVTMTEIRVTTTITNSQYTTRIGERLAVDSTFDRR